MDCVRLGGALIGQNNWGTHLFSSIDKEVPHSYYIDKHQYDRGLYGRYPDIANSQGIGRLQ